MIISLVAAASENNVIGKDGRLPWHLPDDLKHFREVTEGKNIIMGRKTYETIGKPLPNRRNIVVTHQKITLPGCDVVHSLDDAIALAQRDASDEICVIGGGEIYAQALPLASRIHLTRVHTVVEGGTAFFPEFSEAEWQETSRIEHPADLRHTYSFTYLEYERIVNMAS